MLRDLAQAMAHEGWDVNVLTTGTKAEDEKDGPVFIRRIKARAGKTVLNYLVMNFKLYRAVRTSNPPNLIVTMTDPPMLVDIGVRLAKAKKTAHIHWCQDLYPDLLPALGIRLPKFITDYIYKSSRRAMKACDRVVVIGRCMEKHLVQTGLMAQRVNFIPNWPDRELAPGHNIPPPARYLSDNIDLSKPLIVDRNPKFRILYAGNLGRAHAIETILQAAQQLQITNPEIEFIFAGDGEGHERIAQERLRLGLENIRLLPFQPAFQLREMMQGGDVHLISMKDEALGMMVPSKIYAAIAAERPCIFIGPENSEAGRVLKDYKAGSVIRHGDVQGLADAIVRYRMDGSQWFEAHKGARHASEDFNAARSIGQWIICAKAVIGSSAGQ